MAAIIAFAVVIPQFGLIPASVQDIRQEKRNNVSSLYPLNEARCAPFKVLLFDIFLFSNADPRIHIFIDPSAELAHAHRSRTAAPFC